MIAELPRLLAGYGPWLVLLITAAAAIGLPSPASLTLIAAGALSALGGLDYDWLIVAGLAGTIGGDHLAFGIGRAASARVLQWRAARYIERVRAPFARWGIIYIFGSRWIFPTVLVPTTNYFASLSDYPLARFSIAVIAGQFIYVFGYVALGRAFSTQIPRIHAVAAQGSLLLFVGIAAVVSLVVIVRLLLRRRPA